MTSGDKYIRHYLPVVMNNLKAGILNKIDTHALYDFAFYIKRIWLSEYKTECVKQTVMYVIVSHKVICTIMTKLSFSYIIRFLKHWLEKSLV